jgi:hypothetical protein
VRADVVYLRQDFSVMQPVEKTLSTDSHSQKEDPWPSFQRHDYLVRTRALTAAEVKAWQERPAADTYPQREAVLFALRGLTGVDAGSSASDWEATLLEHGFLPGKK